MLVVRVTIGENM